jgi:hypothetical protein
LETYVNRFCLDHRRSRALADAVVAAWHPVEAQPWQPIPVDVLTLGYSPRRGGVTPAHVQRLMETGGAWPPLLVQRSRLVVIDGAHRLAAARALGLETVAAVSFEGSDEAARIEAIRCNRDHGLPLSLADRKQAASDLIGHHPDWSDGRIAEICSLSPKTIGGLRRSRGPSRLEPGRPDRRIGRDGKRHPIGPVPLRDRVAAALAEDPQASLRTIAARVGVSPETVRTVRRARLGPAPTPERLPTIDPELLAPHAPPERWSGDRALASTEEGVRFASWFDHLAVDETALWEHPRAVPTSRTYEVVDEARRRARFWADFADRVEGGWRRRG